eukprot:4475063-Ditylum_brightwellii.AAC.1
MVLLIRSRWSTQKKVDNSAFTIADGAVQHLLAKELLCGIGVCSTIGEEECDVNLSCCPFMVNDLVMLDSFMPIIDKAIDDIQEGQCSVCVSFADSNGSTVVGVIYYPLTNPPTWASGAKSEAYFYSAHNEAEADEKKGLITTNASVSPFLVALMDKLKFDCIPSGGAEKMIMLLEGRCTKVILIIIL